MSSYQHDGDAESSASFRFLLVNFDDTEVLEKYRPGGSHPVHLGDWSDDMGYRVMHKLGAGGFATVWLARDEIEHQWVALKIVVADKSSMVRAKEPLKLPCYLTYASGTGFVVERRSFIIDGPNDRHLCLVLPVLGPSESQLSRGFASRIQPWLPRRASYQTTKAVADLHAQGLCHGDVTTSNIVFALLDIDQYTEDAIYRLFGAPQKEPLKTESGETPGLEAPEYIVKALDFVSSQENIISKDVRLIDFDQIFPITSPHLTILGTPVEFLALEVAVGLEAGPASDVWALRCSIFRLRSGECPCSGYEVTSPADLMRVIIQALGDTPSSWGDTLFDYNGQPTKDPANGEPLHKWDRKRSIKDLVTKIWDQPECSIATTGKVREERSVLKDEKNTPYPSCFSDMFWKTNS